MGKKNAAKKKNPQKTARAKTGTFMRKKKNIMLTFM